MKILFVCLGNICRSPMAAGIMKRLCNDRSIQCVIESAATANWNVGSPADSRALAVTKEHGIDIQAHRARQVNRDDFNLFDRVYALDRQNEIALNKIAPANCKSKIRLLAGDKEIADPYSGDLARFRQTFDLIEQCCINVVDEYDK